MPRYRSVAGCCWCYFRNSHDRIYFHFLLLAKQLHTLAHTFDNQKHQATTKILLLNRFITRCVPESIHIKIPSQSQIIFGTKIYEQILGNFSVHLSTSYMYVCEYVLHRILEFLVLPKKTKYSVFGERPVCIEVRTLWFSFVETEQQPALFKCACLFKW